MQRDTAILQNVVSVLPFFFLNDRAPPEIYPLPLHAALPISPTLEWPRTQTLRASAAFDIDDGRAKRPGPQVPEMRRGRAAPRPPRQDRREGRNRLRGRRSVFEMRRHLERGHPRAETDFRALGRLLARSLRKDLPRVRPG